MQSLSAGTECLNVHVLEKPLTVRLHPALSLLSLACSPRAILS